MLRITRVEDDGGALCLRLEGRIVGDWVEVLESEIAQVEPDEHGLVLDLTRVDFATHPAVVVLRDAMGRGARVLGCSPLIASLLGSTPS